LLAHHLRQLKLPTFLREYEELAAEAAREGLDHARFLLRLAELELIDRERRMVERRIRAARFPAVKSFDTFDFAAIPSLNKPLVLELARCEYVVARDNIIALGNSGTGKTHACLALGLAACQHGFSVAFFTAAGLVHQLMEARDERRLLKLQAQLAAVKLLIVDELGYVPLSQTGAELLFEIFSQRHEHGSTIVTSNLDTSINGVGRWGIISAAARVAGFRLVRTVGAALTTPRGWSGRRDAPQEVQSLDVVDEVRQPDLHRRSGDSNRSNEQIHPVLLLGEDVLDARTDFRFGVVGAPDRFRHRAPLRPLTMDMAGECPIHPVDSNTANHATAMT
jgi:DNA replication protein DnaC